MYNEYGEIIELGGVKINQQTKKKIFDNLDVLGAFIMIVALFLGAFYKDIGDCLTTNRIDY